MAWLSMYREDISTARFLLHALVDIDMLDVMAASPSGKGDGRQGVMGQLGGVSPVFLADSS